MNKSTMRTTGVIGAVAAVVGGCFLLAKPSQGPSAAVPAVQSSAKAARPAPAAAKPSPIRTVSLPAGTVLNVRLTTELDTARNRAGDTFSATLDSPVNVQGIEVLPKSAVFHGRVTESAPSGRLRGRAVLAGELDSLTLRGVNYRVATSVSSHVSGSHKNRNLLAIGGASMTGAMIGGIAGGGAGALIGAGAGAAAGAGGAAVTGKRNLSLPAETLLSFRLKAPLEIRE